MIKLKALKKQLIKTAIIAFAVVAVLGASATALYTWTNSLAKEHKAAENKLRGKQRELAQIDEDAKQAKEFQSLYEDIQSQGKGQLEELDRKQGGIWIESASQQFRLFDVQGKFGGIEPIANKEFQRKTMEAYSSSAEMKFSAMSDEDVLRFVEKLDKTFPGYVKINRFSIKRNAQISDNALVSIAKNGAQPALVNALIDFTLIGVKPIVENSEEAEGADAKE